MDMNSPVIEELFSIEQIPEPEDLREVIFSLMVDPNLAPVNYFNDFTEEVIDPRSISMDVTDGAGLFEIKDQPGTFAMTTHAMHKYLWANPQKAIEILIARATRKMLCYGATPLSVSAFLYHINVADPNGQAIASGAKKGLERAAKKFGVNISDRKIRFDILSEGSTVPPTIIISMLGYFGKENSVLTPCFKDKGNNIFVIGRNYNDIAASEYIESYHDILESDLPVFDIEMEKNIQNGLKKLHRKKLIESASPVGKGGYSSRFCVQGCHPG